MSKIKHNQLSAEDISRIIEMAWEDEVPFEAIRIQYSLKEEEVIALMRNQLKHSSFKMWRRRVNGRKTKHEKKKQMQL